MLSIWAPPAHASEDSRQADRQLPGLEEQWPGQADPPCLFHTLPAGSGRPVWAFLITATGVQGKSRKPT